MACYRFICDILNDNILNIRFIDKSAFYDDFIPVCQTILDSQYDCGDIFSDVLNRINDKELINKFETV